MDNHRYPRREPSTRSRPPQQQIPPPVKQEPSVSSPVEDGIQRRQMINIVRILVGIAVILVCSALLIGLISWVKKDILTSMVFLQSGIQ